MNKGKEPLIDVVLCGDHEQRVGRGEPCDECPSVPENMRKALARAERYKVGQMTSLVASQDEHSELLNQAVSKLDELATGMKAMNKTINNGYLALLSVAVIALMAVLLWWDKVNTTLFSSVLFLCLSPWYSIGILKAFGYGKERRERAVLMLVIAMTVLIQEVVWFST